MDPEQISNAEIAYANPKTVEKLIQAIAVGIQDAIIPGETTTSDMLSAVFTVLYRMLDASERDCTPDERGYNAEEIGRVLKDMLMTFGTSTIQ